MLGDEIDRRRSSPPGSRPGRGALALVVAAAAVALCATEAEAQRSPDIERFRPALDRNGFLGIQGTNVPGSGEWNAAMWLSWSERPLVLRVPDGSGGRDTVGVVDHRLTGDFLAQIGIAGRFALAVDIPLVLWQGGDAAPLRDDGPALPHTAFGDPRVIARARILGENADVERERVEGFGLALLAATTVPIGSDDAFASEPNATVDFQVLTDFHLLGAGAGLMLGWRQRFDKVRFGQFSSGDPVVFREELHFGLGLKVPIPLTHGFTGLAEVRGATDGRSPFGDGARTAIEGELGLRLQRGDFTWTGGVGMGFTDGTGSPSVRGLLGVSWAPRTRDADGDGIPDSEDECPHLPEDFDGFEDEDGCLDPDNDNDLIPDEDDACPDEPADPERDEDMDGCTDPVRDSDGDGIEDRDDACPHEAEDRDGHQDEDGCPEPDNDGDGIADEEDDCPDEPEDMDGFEDGDGCPDPDNDGDGIPDEEDGCPDEPEDMDGFEDDDGCPEPDNDRDGVLDAQDQCPEERETINGRDDDDGCPDQGGRSVWKREGEIATRQMRLSGNVRFQQDGSVHPFFLGEGRHVDQLARHLIGLWPHRWAVAIASGAQERQQALAAALEEREVPAGRYRIVVDESLPAGRVVVRRVEPDDSEQDDGATDGEPAQQPDGDGPANRERHPAEDAPSEGSRNETSPAESRSEDG